MKKIAITGVAGFIGSNLASRLLKEGFEVVGIDNLAYGIQEQIPKGVTFVKTDIRSEDIYSIFKGVDVVFHLAAKNDLTACQMDPVETMDINVRGTANVLEAARRANVKRVVMASSSAVEEGEARLNGFYAISKLTDERLVAGYMQAYGLPCVILRYFNVYGPLQDYRRAHPPLMSSFMIKAIKGERLTRYEDDEKNKRDFIYIDDINDFHLLCVNDKRVEGGLFRLGTGKSTSIDEVRNIVNEISGSTSEPIIVPRSATDIPVSPMADITAAKELGWYARTSLKEGMKAQWEYLREEFAKGSIV